MVQKDEFVSVVEKTATWLEENWRAVLTGVVGTVAILILAGAAVSYLASRGRAADVLLGEAMAAMRAPILGEGELPPVDGTTAYTSRQDREEAALAALDELLDRHPLSRAATPASYLRGTVLLRLDRPAEGRDALAAFVRDHPDSELVPVARRALAAAELEAGDPEAAIAVLQELVDRPTPTFPEDAALMELGRIQEAAGQRAAAVETYRRLVNEHPQSIYSGEAGQAVARLSAPAGTPAADGESS
jgi:tetratricopeptide (TPR) repeat protein